MRFCQTLRWLYCVPEKRKRTIFERCDPSIIYLSNRYEFLSRNEQKYDFRNKEPSTFSTLVTRIKFSKDLHLEDIIIIILVFPQSWIYRSPGTFS